MATMITTTGRRTVALALGIAAVWTAIASPFASMDHERLSMHMLQHLLLAAVAPPLIWLGLPRRLPERVRLAHAEVPHEASRAVRSIAGLMLHPALAWIAATVTILAWHTPAGFETAMRSPFWHSAQRASFFLTGLLFWRPVILAGSDAAPLPNGVVPLYLFAATLPCDVLSAFLVFCDRVVYRHYAADPGSTFRALADQQTAGALMWATVTVVYLIPAMTITMRALSPAFNRSSLDHSSAG
jgi:putative membrane protein